MYEIREQRQIIQQIANLWRDKKIPPCKNKTSRWITLKWFLYDANLYQQQFSKRQRTVIESSRK